MPNNPMAMRRSGSARHVRPPASRRRRLRISKIQTKIRACACQTRSARSAPGSNPCGISRNEKAPLPGLFIQMAESWGFPPAPSARARILGLRPRIKTGRWPVFPFRVRIHVASQEMKKPRCRGVFIRWRRGGDSNPRYPLWGILA